MLAQATFEPYDVDRLSILVGLVLDDMREAEQAQALRDPADDLRIGIRQPPNGLAKTALGVEDSRQEAL